MTQAPDNTQPKRRWVLWVLLGVVLALVGGGAWFYRSVNESIRNAYAVWWVADMVIEYMETHGGKWPSGWDDLEQPYRDLGKKDGSLGNPWPFAELQRRVVIDWSGSPESERASPITLRDGTTSHWDGKEPNQMIHKYLANKRRQ